MVEFRFSKKLVLGTSPWIVYWLDIASGMSLLNTSKLDFSYNQQLLFFYFQSLLSNLLQGLFRPVNARKQTANKCPFKISERTIKTYVAQFKSNDNQLVQSLFKGLFFPPFRSVPPPGWSPQRLNILFLNDTRHFLVENWTSQYL